MTAPVLILMSTYNGAPWLPEQLASIAEQEHRDWALWVSDDNSQDGTQAIICDFAASRAGRNAVELVKGPGLGSAGANFLHLLCRPDLPLGSGTHVAFADQDDIWYPGKLARAVAQLQSAGDRPLLYGAQSRHVDAAGQPNGHVSRRPRRPVDLGNALVQNLVSGHSAVLNPAGARLARTVGVPAGVPYHDWWLSQITLACGGGVLIDTETVLDYRQHGRNTLGEPKGTSAALQRLRLLGRSDFARWIAANLAGLDRAPLTAEARAVVSALQAAPPRGPGRLAAFRRFGLRRQTRLATLALQAAALVGRA